MARMCARGMVIDEVDAVLLAALRRAVPAVKGRTRRLVCLGRPLQGMPVRIVDEDSVVLPSRAVGVIEVRGVPVTEGYRTLAGFASAQDSQGWYDTGDLGYLTEAGDVVAWPRQRRDHHGGPQHLSRRHR